MKRETRKARKCGIGFVSALTLAFIVLKLTGYISWPWLWVFSPVWVSCLLIGAAFSAILIAGRIVKGKW